VLTCCCQFAISCLCCKLAPAFLQAVHPAFLQAVYTSVLAAVLATPRSAALLPFELLLTLCMLLISLLQRPLAMNGTAGGTVNSMDAKEVAGLQAAGTAASQAAGPNPDSINAAPLNQQQQHGDAPAGLEQALAQAAAAGQGGSMVAGMGGQGGGSTLGADGAAALGAMMAAAGGGGGGSVVVGGDNSTGNVNKKLFVKRSCTEAMLKVGGGRDVVRC
jgi:hypothetical protein